MRPDAVLISSDGWDGKAVTSAALHGTKVQWERSDPEDLLLSKPICTVQLAFKLQISPEEWCLKRSGFD